MLGVGATATFEMAKKALILLELPFIDIDSQPTSRKLPGAKRLLIFSSITLAPLGSLFPISPMHIWRENSHDTRNVRLSKSTQKPHSRQLNSQVGKRAPRARGDNPTQPPMEVKSSTCSPRTRG